MFIYEIIPAYIFPLLNGFNIFCLASQHASQKTIDVFTNLFGGADGNEGLGLFSLSFDWQYIGSTYGFSCHLFTHLIHSLPRFMSYPLTQQGKRYIYLPRYSLLNIWIVNSWVGYFFCYIAIMGIYYSNTWNVRPLSLGPYNLRSYQL